MLLGKWYDEKADVWSFAVIAYVLLFGVFPYMPKQQSSKAMKQAIIDGEKAPTYEPVQRVTSGNALMRSEAALNCIRPCLDREPDTRPSAEDALRFPWMRAALQGTHMPGADLPSLRPMLHAAKKVGAFEVRDPARLTAVDVTLNQLQLQRHGVPLPTPGPPGQAEPQRAAPERTQTTPEKTPRPEERSQERSQSLGTKLKPGQPNNKDAWAESSTAPPSAAPSLASSMNDSNSGESSRSQGPAPVITKAGSKAKSAGNMADTQFTALGVVPS